MIFALKNGTVACTVHDMSFNISSFLFKDGVARPMTAVQAAGYTKAAMRGTVCRNEMLSEEDVIFQFSVL